MNKTAHREDTPHARIMRAILRLGKTDEERARKIGGVSVRTLGYWKSGRALGAGMAERLVELGVLEIKGEGHADTAISRTD